MSVKPDGYIVRRSRLIGSVRVSGAKNSALRLLAASLLTDQKVEIDNYPADILDAKIHVQMLEALGKSCEIEEIRLPSLKRAEFEPHSIGKRGLYETRY